MQKTHIERNNAQHRQLLLLESEELHNAHVVVDVGVDEDEEQLALELLCRRTERRHVLVEIIRFLNTQMLYIK